MSHRHILLASAAMASAFSGAALAADKSSTNTIEELIVTAEKREQNLQVVPVAISAYTAKDRETKGIISIQDITNFTPGLSLMVTVFPPAEVSWPSASCGTIASLVSMSNSLSQTEAKTMRAV